MTDTKLISGDRRKLLQAPAAGAGAAALFGGLGVSPMMSTALAEADRRWEKPLKAAFSNAGLQATWCAQGKQAAKSGQAVQRRRHLVRRPARRGQAARRDRQHGLAEVRFVAIQAFGIGTLTAPVNKMIEAGHPGHRHGHADRAARHHQRPRLSRARRRIYGRFGRFQALVNAINGEGTIVVTRGRSAAPALRGGRRASTRSSRNYQSRCSTSSRPTGT